MLTVVVRGAEVGNETAEVVPRLEVEAWVELPAEGAETTAVLADGAEAVVPGIGRT